MDSEPYVGNIVKIDSFYENNYFLGVITDYSGRSYPPCFVYDMVDHSCLPSKNEIRITILETVNEAITYFSIDKIGRDRYKIQLSELTNYHPKKIKLNSKNSKIHNSIKLSNILDEVKASYSTSYEVGPYPEWSIQYFLNDNYYFISYEEGLTNPSINLLEYLNTLFDVKKSFENEG